MRTLKYTWLVTICLYILVYICYTFIVFRFDNPFLWIIRIPDMDQGDRAGLLSGWAIYYGMCIVIVHGVLSDLDDKRKKANCKHEKRERYQGLHFTEICIDCKKLLDK